MHYDHSSDWSGPILAHAERSASPPKINGVRFHGFLQTMKCIASIEALLPEAATA